MRTYVNNLKRAAEENPVAALLVAAVAITATAKLIDAVGGAVGSAAYARATNHRLASK